MEEGFSFYVVKNVTSCRVIDTVCSDFEMMEANGTTDVVVLSFSHYVL